MKNRKLTFGLAIVLALAALGALLVFLRSSSDAEVAVAESGAVARKDRRIAEAKPSAGQSKSSKAKMASSKVKALPVQVADEDDRLSPAEKKIAEDLQTASDDNDFKAVQKAVEAAMSSRNPVLLKRAAEACRWFGEKALPELTAIAALGHELAEKAARRSSRKSSSHASGESASGESAEEGDVPPELLAESEAIGELIQESMGGIESALSEIENDSIRAKLTGEYMKTTSDEDMLTMLEGQLNGVLNERAAVEAALDVIANGSATAAEHAKEVYRFQTGEDYTTPEAAQQWLSEKTAEAAEAATAAAGEEAAEAEQVLTEQEQENNK